MKPYCERVGVALYHADCLQLLPTLAECSVDTVVTDPPYELTGKHGPRSPQYAEGGKAHYGERTGGFMGMAWDATGIAFRVETWQTILRVLKPGGYLLAFGGTRTYHRMVCAIEDAGFEVRDCLMWLYGSGFPKSLDVSKALDKAAGAEREITGRVAGMGRQNPEWNGTAKGRVANSFRPEYDATLPATDAAHEWSGWGTGLKPAWESIVWATKPLTDRGERHIIVATLSRLEAQLWSLLPANTAVESFGLSPSEYAEACAFARWNAGERRSTLDGLPGQMDTSRFVSVMSSCLSIVRSWRSILVESCASTSTSTTSTGSSTTTDWKTLRSCLSVLTPACIVQAAMSQPGSWSLALPAARKLTVALANMADTLTPSVQEPATSKDGDSILRPNVQPIILARKPLSERNVAANVLKWGTGAINVDGCRIATDDYLGGGTYGGVFSGTRNADGSLCKAIGSGSKGRWPANLVLSHLPECREVGVRRVKGSYLNHEVHGDNTQFAFRGKASTHNTGYADPDGTEMVPSWECAPGCPVAMLDEQSGERKGAVSNGSSGSNPSLFNPGRLLQVPSYADSGGASRFFYTAKASRSERGEGNNHPTVKPLSLMRYLCRLVTPPGGLILDPFTGSGTTALAAILEGFRFVGAEQDERYCEIAARRLSQEVLPLEEALP